MAESIYSPAQVTYWGLPGQILFLLINLLGVACFAYIAAKRLTPLVRANHDFRFDRPLLRLRRLLQFWLGQWKQPRYPTAGTMHILIFAGFIILATQAFSLLGLGMTGKSFVPEADEGIGYTYGIIKDYAASIVFLCMVFASVRRIVFKPERYDVPSRFGKSHKVDAIFLLGLIALLMASESLFTASPNPPARAVTTPKSPFASSFTTNTRAIPPTHHGIVSQWYQRA